MILADYRMPRDERHRVPRTGHGHLPGRPAGAADRLRRHRCGHRRDQRRGPRLLPAQALGPARGEALPGGGLRCWRPGWRRITGRCPRLKVVGHRWSARSSEVREFLARNQVPYRWYPSDETGGPAAARRGRRGRAAAAGGDHAGRRGAGGTRGPGAGGPGGAGDHAVGRLLRPRGHRRRPGRPGRGRLRRLGRAADRAGRADRDRRPGRARVPGSRTTSASPTGCPGRSSPTGPGGRRPSSARSCSPPARWPAWRSTARPGRSGSPTAPRSTRTPSSSPPGWPTGSSTAPGLADLTGRGVYYGSALTEATGCAGPRCLHRRRGQLGRPGGGVPVPAAPGR